MSSGGWENTRITLPTRWLISWRGFSLSYRLGLEFIVCRGALGKPSSIHWAKANRYISRRDIPMPLVSSGVENGNLRQLALDRMKDFGAECRDVRYREVGVSVLGQGAIYRAVVDPSLITSADV